MDSLGRALPLRKVRLLREFWQMAGGIRRFGGCRFGNRVTAGTVFGDGRKSLRLWFGVMWPPMAQKTVMGAREFHDAFGFGGHRTSWGWLRKPRSVMIRAGRERPSGRVGPGGAVRGRCAECRKPVLAGVEKAKAAGNRGVPGSGQSAARHRRRCGSLSGTMLTGRQRRSRTG